MLEGFKIAMIQLVGSIHLTFRKGEVNTLYKDLLKSGHQENHGTEFLRTNRYPTEELQEIIVNENDISIHLKYLFKFETKEKK